MNNIHARIQLNETVNNVKFWQTYCTEYETLDINPNDPPDTESTTHHLVLENHNMIRQMIDEQIVLSLCSMFRENEALIKWFKAFYVSLYHKIINQKGINKKLIPRLLIIIGKMRLIFKNDSTSIRILDCELLKIPKRMNEFIDINTTEIMQSAWNAIKQYRYAYNQHIIMNSALLQDIQIGLSKSKKFEYKLNQNYSILTHWALLRHRNQNNQIYRIKNKQHIEEYINLTKHRNKYKIGKGGAYSTDSAFRQLDIVSANNIYPDQLKLIGTGIYEMIPKVLHSFLPPLMCGNTIRRYQTVQMNWYYEQINAKILNNRHNPVVNASLDAATFKGHWGAKVIPMELTTYHKQLKCGFRWSETHQPINPTKETGHDLLTKLNEFTDKFPSIKQLNAIACDDGPTSSTHLNLQRATNKLLIQILDFAHLFNTVIQVPIKEVWGYIKIEFNQITVTKTMVPTMIKLTSKKVEKNPQYLSQILQHYAPNEFRRNKASSDTRFSGNIDAASTLITKRLTEPYNSNIYSDDSADSDDEWNDAEEIHSIKLTKINALKPSKPLDLIRLLPELSDNENETLSFKSVISKFKSSHKHRVDIDKRLYKKHEHLESFKKQNLTFDIKRFVLILEVIATDPDFDEPLLKNFWTQRANCAAILTIHSVGQKVIKPIIDLTVLNRNRLIELYPLIARKFQTLHEMRYALQHLVTQFDALDITEAVEYIVDKYRLFWRARCARLHRKSNLFKWCNVHKKGLKQYACNGCIRQHASPKLNLLNKLLPPKSFGNCINFIQKLFRNVITLKSMYDAEECESILSNNFGDIFAFTTSDIFDQWNTIDGLTVLEAKVVIYVQLLRFVEFCHYKFVERWIHCLEGAICIPPLLRHPYLGLIMAINIIYIGYKIWLQRSALHVNLREFEFEQILKHKVEIEYYCGGMKYLYCIIWNLIYQLAQQNNWEHLINDTHFIVLLDFIDEHCVCTNNTIHVEKMNKPLKEMTGSQTNSEQNINRRFWNRDNLKNGLFHHPVVYINNKNKIIPDISAPDAFSELCQAFTIPEEEIFHQFRTDLNSIPHAYHYAFKDPKQAKGIHYDTAKALTNISKELNNNNKKRKLKSVNNKKKKRKLSKVSSKQINNGTKVTSSGSLPQLHSNNVSINDIFNMQTNQIKKWNALSSHIRQSIVSIVGYNESINKRIWNQMTNEHDMIHMYLVEAGMKMAQQQNTSLDLGYGITGKCNDLRLLNAFGAHILHCSSYPHFILTQKNVNGDIFVHDSMWSNASITDEVKLYMAQLFGEYKTKCINFIAISGQQQTRGSLLCAIYCVARLTEMVYGNDELSRIYFKESAMKTHFAFCIASGKLIKFPQIENGSFIEIPQQIKLICICNKPKCFDRKFKTCNKCQVQYHWKCIAMDSEFIKFNSCNLCVSSNTIGNRLYTLTNLGNTCFCNATLQILLNTPKLCQYYANNNQIHLTEICRAFANFNQTQQITNLISYLKNDEHFKHLFMSMRQQDAADIFVTFQHNLNASVISNVFGGMFQSTLTCQQQHCKYVSAKLEPFTNISVPLKWTKNIENSIKIYYTSQCLQQCLERFCEPEIVSDFKCSQCNKPGVQKQLKWVELPQNLVITLNRFENNWLNKYCSLISAPINKLQLPNAENILYDLYAVVNHYGTTTHGHYTANIKKNVLWYNMDDSVITPIVNVDVVSKDAYILCYRKR